MFLSIEQKKWVKKNAFPFSSLSTTSDDMSMYGIDNSILNRDVTGVGYYDSFIFQIYCDNLNEKEKKFYETLPLPSI